MLVETLMWVGLDRCIPNELWIFVINWQKSLVHSEAHVSAEALQHSHGLRFVPRRPHWPLTKFKQQKSYTAWRARISPSLHRVEEPFLEAFKLLEKRYDSGMTMTGYEKIRMIATALVWHEWNVPSSNTQCKRHQYMSININIITYTSIYTSMHV